MGVKIVYTFIQTSHFLKRSNIYQTSILKWRFISCPQGIISSLKLFAIIFRINWNPV
jgi:hypothetical protein